MRESILILRSLHHENIPMDFKISMLVQRILLEIKGFERMKFYIILQDNE